MSDKSYTDIQFVEMIAGGSEEREVAIRTLMKEEIRQKRITRQLLRLGAKPEECEEIVNDAFVALITGITRGKFQTGSSIWAYLYGAARNILWKMRRGEKLGNFLPVETIQGDPDASVEERIILGERREHLRNIFRQLSEKCQNILHLAFFEERSNEEIAETLGYKSKAVVGVKKSECLKGLASLLKNAEVSFE